MLLPLQGASFTNYNIIKTFFLIVALHGQASVMFLESKRGCSEHPPCLNVRHGCWKAGALTTDLTWNHRAIAEDGG